MQNHMKICDEHLSWLKQNEQTTEKNQEQLFSFDQDDFKQEPRVQQQQKESIKPEEKVSDKTDKVQFFLKRMESQKTVIQPSISEDKPKEGSFIVDILRKQVASLKQELEVANKQIKVLENKQNSESTSKLPGLKRIVKQESNAFSTDDQEEWTIEKNGSNKHNESTEFNKPKSENFIVESLRKQVANLKQNQEAHKKSMQTLTQVNQQLQKELDMLTISMEAKDEQVGKIKKTLDDKQISFNRIIDKLSKHNENLKEELLKISEIFGISPVEGLSEFVKKSIEQNAEYESLISTLKQDNQKYSQTLTKYQQEYMDKQNQQNAAITSELQIKLKLKDEEIMRLTEQLENAVNQQSGTQAINDQFEDTQNKLNTNLQLKITELKQQVLDQDQVIQNLNKQGPRVSTSENGLENQQAIKEMKQKVVEKDQLIVETEKQKEQLKIELEKIKQEVTELQKSKEDSKPPATNANGTINVERLKYDLDMSQKEVEVLYQKVLSQTNSSELNKKLKKEIEELNENESKLKSKIKQIEGQLISLRADEVENSMNKQVLEDKVKQLQSQLGNKSNNSPSKDQKDNQTESKETSPAQQTQIAELQAKITSMQEKIDGSQQQILILNSSLQTQQDKFEEELKEYKSQVKVLEGTIETNQNLFKETEIKREQIIQSNSEKIQQLSQQNEQSLHIIEQQEQKIQQHIQEIKLANQNSLQVVEQVKTSKEQTNNLYERLKQDFAMKCEQHESVCNDLNETMKQMHEESAIMKEKLHNADLLREQLDNKIATLIGFETKVSNQKIEDLISMISTTERDSSALQKEIEITAQTGYTMNDDISNHQQKLLDLNKIIQQSGNNSEYEGIELVINAKLLKANNDSIIDLQNKIQKVKQELVDSQCIDQKQQEHIQNLDKQLSESLLHKQEALQEIQVRLQNIQELENKLELANSEILQMKQQLKEAEEHLQRVSKEYDEKYKVLTTISEQNIQQSNKYVSTIKTLDIEIQAIVASKIPLQNEISELNCKLTDAEIKFNNELSIHKQEIMLESSKVEQVQKEIEKQTKEFQLYKNKKESEIQLLNVKIEKNLKVMNELEQLITEKDAQIQKIEHETFQLEQERDAIQNDALMTIREYELLKDKYNNLVKYNEEQRLRMQQQSNIFKDSQLSLTNRIDQLQEDLIKEQLQNKTLESSVLNTEQKIKVQRNINTLTESQLFENQALLLNNEQNAQERLKAFEIQCQNYQQFIKQLQDDNNMLRNKIEEANNNTAKAEKYADELHKYASDIYSTKELILNDNQQLKNSIHEQNALSDATRQHVQNYQEQIIQLTGQLQEYKNAIKDQTDKDNTLIQLQTELRLLNGQNKLLNDKVIELVNNNNKEKNEMLNFIQTLELQLQQKENTSQSLEVENVQETQAEFEKYKQSQDTLIKEIVNETISLQKQIDFYKQNSKQQINFEQITVDSTETTQKLKQLENELSIVQQDNDNKKMSIQDLQNQIHQQITEINKLQLENQNWQTTILQLKSQTKSKFVGKSEQLRDYDQQLQNLNLLLQQYAQHISVDVQDQNLQLMNQLIKQIECITLEQNKIQEYLNDAIFKQNQTNQAQFQALVQKMREIRGLELKIFQFTDQFDQSEAEMSVLKQELVHYEEAIKQNKEYKIQLLELKSKYQNKSQGLQHHQKSLQALQIENAQLNEQNCNLFNIIDQYQMLSKGLNADSVLDTVVHTFKQLINQFWIKVNKTVEQDDMIEQYINDLQELEEINFYSQQDAKSLNSKYQAILSEHKTLTEDQAHLNQKLSEQQAKLAVYTDEIQHLQTLTKQYNIQEQKHQTNHSLLQNENQTLKLQLAQLQNTDRDSSFQKQNTINDLKVKLIEQTQLINNLKRESSQKQTQIDKLKIELDNQSIQWSENAKQKDTVKETFKAEKKETIEEVKDLNQSFKKKIDFKSKLLTLDEIIQEEINRSKQIELHNEDILKQTKQMGGTLHVGDL
ncbi:Conserved_hypothetical protein [Hexamita inflata]|uniref:Uncharacterized protein n=1 Tax=Hexamita inflata TaxID=28002 RepID=A0AA86NEK3_9EUKA|nr:Conserved hypothetical protein [Hexamita inflata]CAI9940070.1 Conserved hypothetical protein [Hexamita inflata]